MVTFESLLSIVHRLTLLTSEDDDKMHGVYIDKRNPSVVRAKGSTLALIADARRAIEESGWSDE